MIWNLSLQSEIIYGVQSLSSFLPASFWQTVTDYGEINILIGLLLASSYHRGQIWLSSALMAISTSAIITYSLKGWFNFPRPPSLLPLEKLTVIGEVEFYRSFPSGHTNSAMSFCVLIFFLSAHRKWRIAAVITWLTIAISRIIVGAHWPQDIIAGSISGLIFTTTAFILIQWLLKKLAPQTTGAKVEHSPGWQQLYLWFAVALICIPLENAVVTASGVLVGLIAWWQNRQKLSKGLVRPG